MGVDLGACAQARLTDWACGDSHGCRGIGFEIDSAVAAAGRKRIADAGLEGSVEVSVHELGRQPQCADALLVQIGCACTFRRCERRIFSPLTSAQPPM